ncbi:hypothetical protein DDB_G0287063 [Dictyostelium discoideum AX4]|uniref:Dickkopf N-terminal cysteine-rich domain-containing protein n=1 Tax=Dictyostelium discoideum TaxID=44689 RepID=Q54KW4_DICDI|nr:hypothetical protein DDB_G0287063 [Dictyostelium discoideum AX4]EAL63896.1 hypothetical protein DDB_G0287063 [Dictyostelium discoideum AX4]|eukprot:XP_637406.1 hypothetical protein DDB_G0287063 [Dictyostelium discoideum AX4]
MNFSKLLFSIIVVLTVVVLLFNNENILVEAQVGNLCIKCLEFGESCNSNGACSKDSVCTSDTERFQENPVCSEPKELGQDCKNDEQCRLGTKCKKELNNEFGSCSDIKFAQVGEKCSQDFDCSGRLLKCKEGICVKPTGDLPCGVENPCPFGEYCQYSSKTCNKQLKENDNCLQSTQCPVGHFCDETSKKCKKSFTLLENDKCASFSHDQCNTDLDLYCAKAGICEKLNITYPGLCLRMENHCSPFHQCSCSDYKCHPTREFGSSFVKTYKDFNQCIEKHKCQFTYNRFSNNSCITKNCGPQFCKFNRALQPDNQLNCGKVAITNYCQTVNHLFPPIKSKIFLNHSKEDLFFFATSIPFLILFFSVYVEIKLARKERLDLIHSHRDISYDSDEDHNNFNNHNNNNNNNNNNTNNDEFDDYIEDDIDENKRE